MELSREGVAMKAGRLPSRNRSLGAGFLKSRMTAARDPAGWLLDSCSVRLDVGLIMMPGF